MHDGSGPSQNEELQEIARSSIQLLRPAQLRGAPQADAYFPLYLLLEEGNYIRDDEAFNFGLKILIVGGPGSGKTMLLKHLARQHCEAFLNGTEGARPAIFLSAADLCSEKEDSLAAAAASLSARQLSLATRTDTLKGYLEAGDVTLLVDGVDEIANGNLSRQFVRSLVRFAFSSVEGMLAVSTRPVVWQEVGGAVNLTGDEEAIAGAFAGFVSLPLAELTLDDTTRAARLLSSDENLISEFESALAASEKLAALCSSPLVLRLLWQLFETTKELPQTYAALYQDITEYLLSAWEQRKGFVRSNLPLASRQAILGDAAMRLLETGQNSLSEAELVELVEPTLRRHGLLGDVTATEAVQDIRISGGDVFAEVSDG